MAIFGSKKNTKKEVVKDVKEEVKKELPATAVSVGESLTYQKRDLNQVIVKPRVTEKATFCAEKNVCVFEIADWAGKKEVFSAIKKIYKISPVKVSVARIPSKKVFIKGKNGIKSGGKKAYVYLKEGDKIEMA